MVSINRVIVAGNLVKDPELKITASKRKFSTMTIAVNEFWRNQKGELTKKTTFINLIAWGSIAENSVKYLSKGKSVMAEGRIETDSFIDRNNCKRTITRVMCSSITYIGNKLSNKKANNAPVIMEGEE